MGLGQVPARAGVGPARRLASPGVAGRVGGVLARGLDLGVVSVGRGGPPGPEVWRSPPGLDELRARGLRLAVVGWAPGHRLAGSKSTSYAENFAAPDEARGLIPGFAYQLGILFAAGTNTIEYAMRDKLGYSWALTVFEVANILLLITVVGLGSEKKGKSFLREQKT